MRTPLVWTLRVTISPWYSWPDFLKVPMLAMSLLLGVRARDHRGLDGDLQAEGDRRRIHLGAEAQGRMAGVRLSCLARKGRSPGEESLTAAVAAQAIEAQTSFGQIKPSEARWLASVRQHCGEDVAEIEQPAQEAARMGRRKRNPCGRKGPLHGRTRAAERPQADGVESTKA